MLQGHARQQAPETAVLVEDVGKLESFTLLGEMEDTALPWKIRDSTHIKIKMGMLTRPRNLTSANTQPQMVKDTCVPVFPVAVFLIRGK